MPRKPNPELKKMAMRLFGQGYSASQILEKLEDEAKNSLRTKLAPKYSGKELEKKVEDEVKKWHLPTCEDTLYDWKKDMSRKAEETKMEFISTLQREGGTSIEAINLLEKIMPGKGRRQEDKKRKSETMERTEAPPAETPEPSKTEGKPFPEEPSLADFTARNIPPKEALKLLAELDAARHDNDTYKVNVVRKIVELRNEFPGIPLEDARAIAGLEVKGEEFDMHEVREMARLCRRYRSWEGNDNKRQMLKVARYLGILRPSSEIKIKPWWESQDQKK